MAVPTISTGNSNAVSTGILNHSMPAVIAAGDIIVIVVGVTLGGAGTAATAITRSNAASQAFTELFQVTVFNSAGTAKGRVAVYYKVADGTEDGVTAQFTHDGSTGSTVICFFGNSFLVAGADTTTPVHTSASNNPNYSEGTITPHPAITTSVADCLSVLFFHNGDNINITTPTNWTTQVSASNGTGTDAALDCDKRDLATAGTYTPGSVTLSTTSADIGWAGFHIAFQPPAGGTAHTVDPADSVTMSDSLTFDRGLSVADTLSLSDALTFARDLLFADTLSLADAVTFDRAIEIADTLSLTDDVATAMGAGHEVTVNDSVTVDDALSFDRMLAIAEDLTVVDAFAFDRGMSVADVLSLSDSVVTDLQGPPGEAVARLRTLMGLGT